MASSPGFGSSGTNLTPYSDSLSLRLQDHIPLALPVPANSLAHFAKGTPSPALRPAPTSRKQTRFQYYFTPLTGGLFTFPSRYLFTIDLATYLALEGDPPRFPPDFTCPVVLRCRIKQISIFRLRDSHPLWLSVPGSFVYIQIFLLFGLSPCDPTTPLSNDVVWAYPRSLATTNGISLISFPPGT
jgi:hypothetical protein